MSCIVYLLLQILSVPENVDLTRHIFASSEHLFLLESLFLLFISILLSDIFIIPYYMIHHTAQGSQRIAVPDCFRMPRAKKYDYHVKFRVYTVKHSVRQR